ncbi:uncharacterized protein LOC100378469 [Saccoglossus kowalevskii]|uniref:Uncharacterized protein LOC100378469 n=1 Tax=Saccoglossus kowalevskii TaxID=10224 RepID=A0ABM0GQX7_SACKO|nr:PREDICTED: uncharacterized protein LOC100378469 [Saccoglossus kowalevskii]
MKTHSVGVLFIGLILVQLISVNNASCRNRWKVLSMASCKRSEIQPTFKEYVAEFRIFDLNEDGVITDNEVQRLVEFLQSADLNGDGKVSLSEYIKDGESSEEDQLNV